MNAPPLSSCSPRRRWTRGSLPWATFGLVGAALVVALVDAAGRASLVHLQGDLADGRWWTPWSAHLVHFSASHLFWDCLAIGVLGWLLERRAGSPRLLLGVFLAAPLISLGVMTLRPDLAGYGGFSGLACALAGALGAAWWRQGQPCRAAVLGIALAAKVTWEWLHPGAALLVNSREEVVPVASAHALGALAGFLLATVRVRPSRFFAGRRSAAGSCG